LIVCAQIDQKGGARNIYEPAATYPPRTNYIYSTLEIDMAQSARSTKRPVIAALVVDDEPLIRFVMREALEDLGLEVYEAADGESGLATLLAHASIGLVVTDIGMPRMDGLTMLARARESRQDFIALTTSGHAEAPPGEAFLRKPYRSSELQARVTEIL
jgi:CheY-like chemotaxis protein